MANIININGSKKPSSSLVSTLTAEAANVRSGKTFIGKNNRDTQTGSMPNAVVITPTGKSATAKVTGLTYSYNSTNDNFTVAHSSQASATVSVQPSVSTAGYISSSEGTKTANNVTAYGQVAATVAKVKTGVDITGTTTKQPSISRTAKPSGDSWTDAASGAATTTKPTSGVYVQVNTAATTGTLTATPKVTTAGYGTTAYYGATAGTATVGASASAATYIPITTATLPTSAASSATSGYTSKATIGRSTSAQYINIPPGYNTAGAYYTISAVANGSATTPATTISPTVSTISLAYNSTNDNFDVSGSGSTTKSVTPTVVAGYISSGTAGTITGSASVAATVAKIAGSVSISGTKTYKPSITRSSFSISGVTDGANGAATTTAPTSGVYVKVSSAANTGNVTAGVTISTAGYGTSSNHGISGSGNVAVGASASDATYVPIKTATPAFTGGAVSGSVSNITGSNVTLSDTNNGISVTGSGTANRTAVTYNGAVNGYVVVSSGTAASAAPGTAATLTSKTRYITAITVPKDKTFSVTSTADTALDTSSDITITNNAYRHIKVTNNANGSTTITNSGLAYVNSSSATAGSLTVSAYNSSGNAENSKSVVTNGKWVATTVTPSGSAQGPYYGRVSVNAISSTYVGSGITARSSSDLTVSGATVTAPAGYYASDASKSIDSGSLSSGNGSASTTGTGITLTAASSQPSSGIYITTTGSGTVSVGTAGYLAANTSKTSNTATKYYTIAGSTVTSSQSLPSGSSAAGTAGYGTYAKVSAGYYASDRYIGSGVSAGTIATPTGKSATAIVTALKYTYNSTNDNFTVAHNSQASATVSVTPSVSTAGYVSSSVGTKTANNVTAYGQVNTTLAKIAGSVSISGTKTYKPSITRSAFTISGVTDGASGAATTTAPSSGVYVKVSSAANTGNVTGAATISTAGYGTSSYHGIAGSGNVAVGAAASDATYVPIKTASPAFDGGGISGSVGSITGSNVTLSDTDNGISVTAAASAARAAVLYNGAVNGYVIKADNAEALAATTSNTALTGLTKYITSIYVPASKSFSIGGQGTVTYSPYNATAGSLLVSAYDSNGNSTGGKTVVTAGKWKSTTVTPSTSAQGPFYGRTTVNAVPTGSVTAPASISGTNAQKSTANHMLTLTKTISITPNVTTAGYITAGTAGNTSVSLSVPMIIHESLDETLRPHGLHYYEIDSGYYPNGGIIRMDEQLIHPNFYRKTGGSNGTTPDFDIEDGITYTCILTFVEGGSINGYIRLQGYDETSGQYVTIGQAKQSSEGYMVSTACQITGGSGVAAGQVINKIRLIYRPNGSGTARGTAVIIQYSQPQETLTWQSIDSNASFVY